MAVQREMTELQDDQSDLSDLDLVETVIGAKAVEEIARGDRQRALAELGRRLEAKGLMFQMIGDHRVQVAPKCDTLFDQDTLHGLMEVVSDHQMWAAVCALPSTAQFKALAEHVPGVDRIVAAARQRVETGELKVLIKTPKRHRRDQASRFAVEVQDHIGGVLSETARQIKEGALDGEEVKCTTEVRA
ncbi:MAG: hypothetical protein A2V88_13985 [Elusimicrobia bacterium RBG_16_66_12]|nr:MAG: hypothetical protein A2V88_13985 [Elusimicrobia bacterium RBG_16_66_12]